MPDKDIHAELARDRAAYHTEVTEIETEYEKAVEGPRLTRMHKLQEARTTWEQIVEQIRHGAKT